MSRMLLSGVKERSVSKRGLVFLICIIILYALFRIAALPANPTETRGFTHDGAYLSIAARNLHDGNGFVLDALWPVFAQRGTLPMPCENANPLYPLLMAGVMALFGIAAPQAGFLVSALSSVGLIAAVVFLLRKYVGDLYIVVAIAFAVALFPPVWDSSWVIGPDELWVALMVAFVAALVRSERLAMAAVAGLFFGLAWLTRSAATTVLPGLLVWAPMALGWRKAIPRMVVLAGAAAVVAAPWLIYSKKLWGEPLHSNAAAMTAAHVDSWQYGRMVTRGFHKPTPARPPAEVFKENPGRFVSEWARGIVPVLRELLRSTQGSVGVAVLPTGGRAASLGVLVLLAAIAVLFRPAVLRHPMTISIGAFTAVFVAVLSMGGTWTEGRYFILNHVFFVAWTGVTLYEIAKEYHGRRWPPLYVAGFALAALYIAVLLPISDYRDASYQRSVNADVAAYAQAARSVNEAITRAAPVVVGDYPYYYSAATKAQALAIPEATDEYLLSFMDRYAATHVVLSEKEREFWRPAWAENVPQGLRLQTVWQQKYYIYARVHE
jgi:hypothetical protein